MQLIGLAQKKGAEVFLADASLFLELFGIVAVSWQWLKMAVAAVREKDSKKYSMEFFNSKIHTLQYFFEYELPKTKALHSRLKSENHLTVNAPSSEIV